VGYHLYCLVPPGARPSKGLAGIDGAPVTGLDEGPLGLWVSEMETAPRPTVDGIRAHDRVIRAAMDAGSTPLPMRFGQWFSNRRRLVDRLEEKGAAYQAALADLEGSVEMGVRIVDPSEILRDSLREQSAGSGREFMEGLARLQRESRGRDELAQALAEDLRKRLGAVARRERVEPLEPGLGVVSIAHLVARSEVTAYRQVVENAGRDRPDLSYHRTGPWPPYSFVE